MNYSCLNEVIKQEINNSDVGTKATKTSEIQWQLEKWPLANSPNAAVQIFCLKELLIWSLIINEDNKFSLKDYWCNLAPLRSSTFNTIGLSLHMKSEY